MQQKQSQMQKEQRVSRVVYCAYIVKGGQRIYPRRAKVFRIVLSH
jgi:hypothetical protein